MLDGDWSSDVCSSDLILTPTATVRRIVNMTALLSVEAQQAR
jgi:phosphotransacetylase